jgi:hypothetical protein
MIPVTNEPDVATQLTNMLDFNGLHEIRVVNQADQNDPKGNLRPVDSTGGESNSRNRSPVTHSDMIFESKSLEKSSSV